MTLIYKRNIDVIYKRNNASEKRFKLTNNQINEQKRAIPFFDLSNYNFFNG